MEASELEPAASKELEQFQSQGPNEKPELRPPQTAGNHLDHYRICGYEFSGPLGSSLAYFRSDAFLHDCARLLDRTQQVILKEELERGLRRIETLLERNPESSGAARRDEEERGYYHRPRRVGRGRRYEDEDDQ